MNTNLKGLIGKLNETTRKALEAAATRAHGVDRVGNEIVKHLANVVFEAEDGRAGDISRVDLNMRVGKTTLIEIQDGIDEIGIYRGGVFYLDTNGNGKIDDQDAVIQLGQPGDVPVVGDWDGDGREEVGVYRDGEIATHTARKAG